MSSTAAGQQAWCGGCLSRGRRVSPLGTARAAHLLWSLGEDAEATLEVCWECRTLVDKAMLFCERARRAAAVLRTHQILSASNGDISMSNLGHTTKIGFDQEFYHQNVSPNDIKGQESHHDNNDSWYTDDIHTTFIKEEPAIDPYAAEENVTVAVKFEQGPTTNSEPHLKNVYEINIENTPCTSENKDILSRVEEFADATTAPGNSMESTEHEPSVPQNFNGSDEVLRSLMSEKDMLASRDVIRSGEIYLKSQFKCEKCILGFANFTLLNLHNRRFHIESVGAYACDVCGCRFPSAANMAEHQLTHYHQYVCGACGFTHRQYTEVKNHRRLEHASDKTFVCKTCGEHFLSKFRRNYHVSKYHHEPVICPVCCKVFKVKSHLTTHMKIHKGLPELECEVCHKKLHGSGALRTHMRLKHEEPPEMSFCAECNLQFASTAVYENHLKTLLKHVDKNDYKYICDHCERRFINKFQLQKHIIVVHEKIYEYKCDICDKGFSKSYGRDKHIQRVHQGVQPAKNKLCSVCGKCFSTKTALSSHMRVHTGERPYVCDICQATFNQHASLNTHKKLVHLKMKRTKDGWVGDKETTSAD